MIWSLPWILLMEGLEEIQMYFFQIFTLVDLLNLYFLVFCLLKPRSGFRFIKRLGNSNSKHFRSAFKARCCFLFWYKVGGWYKIICRNLIICVILYSMHPHHVLNDLFVYKVEENKMYNIQLSPVSWRPCRAARDSGIRIKRQGPEDR